MAKYFYHTSINSPPTEDLSNEKMKEIAQQFALACRSLGAGRRQILEQNPATLTHDQIHAIILEIQRLYSKTEQSTSYQSSNLKMVGYSIQNLQAKADRLSNHLDQLSEKMSQAAVIFRKSQRVSICLPAEASAQAGHRYWMVILMGILSTLITNMVWIIRG